VAADARGVRGGPALVVPRQRVRLVVQEPLDELEEALLAGEVQARVPPAVARVDVPGAEEVAQAAEIIRFGALVHRRVLRREDLRALDVLLVLEVVDAVADGPRLWLLRVLLAEHLLHRRAVLLLLQHAIHLGVSPLGGLPRAARLPEPTRKRSLTIANELMTPPSGA
jgi:hypothetical protein